MSTRALPLGKSVRLAIVTKVDKNYVTCQFYDKLGEKSIKCPLPHPYAGRGGGIFVGIERDSMVVVANASAERWFIVGVIPSTDYYNIEGVPDVRAGESSYPTVQEGEVILKGNAGQRLDILSNGNIALDASIGSKSYDLELSKFSQGMFVRVNNVYTFTEAGRTIEGVIKRDKNESEDALETTTTDFLTSESYDSLLTPIGRSPKNEVQNITTNMLRAIVRNPALVERRDITYEYADSFGVKDFDSEKRAMRSISTGSKDSLGEIKDGIETLRRDQSLREERRTDVLDLNLRNYNHLIEEVKGTLVDIYGNVLDLNRNPIEIPSVETISQNTDSSALLKIYDYLRRSVKYHVEINSRKADVTGTEPNKPSKTDFPIDNLKDHSRFSIDVDAEGLTKVNIPASSDTGNIPVLGRHIVTRDEQNPNNGAFKSAYKKDLRLAQFGAVNSSAKKFAGQKISNTDYLRESFYDYRGEETTNNPTNNSSGNDLTTTVGTAFHDLFKTANSIFTNGKWKNNTDPNSDEVVLPLNEKITNRAKTPEDGPDVPSPNAGGRSLHLNLDGSLEASVGADTVDHKSFVLDTAGGTISHFGRDNKGRSIVHQSDGTVLIQIGGAKVKDFPSTTEADVPGRLEIHLFNPRKPNDPSKVIIDENGMTLYVNGNTLMRSDGDFIISSSGSLLLDAENIYEYGSYDEATRTIGGTETRIKRDGRK